MHYRASLKNLPVPVSLEDSHVRSSLWLTVAAVSAIGGVGLQKSQRRFNPVVEVLAANKPVFGLYAPANRRGGRGGAPPPADAPPPKTPAQLAQEAIGNTTADYLFDGSMEGDFDRGYAPFVEFMKGMAEAGPLDKTPTPRLHHPLFVKTHEIAPDPALARERIGKQLNLGVSGIVFVGVESADEVKTGLAAMRFKSKGGTRSDDVGGAPAYWGMSEKEYKDKADVWPLNPNGELLISVIIESKPGIANARAIAAMPGVAIVTAGAGTLGGVFSSTDSTGRRVRDQAGFDAGVAAILAACKEFKKSCGYPANNPAEVEKLMKDGWDFLIMQRRDQAAFDAVLTGRRLSGRPTSP